jgi:hypothetical protein
LLDRALDGGEVLVVCPYIFFSIFLLTIICCNIPYDKSYIKCNGEWNQLSEKVENISDHPKIFNLLFTGIDNAIKLKSSPNINHEVF